jgi:hypothetical protein
MDPAAGLRNTVQALNSTLVEAHMLAFRILLLSMLSAVLIYTGVVVSTQGWNFMPVFLADLLALKWPGQFNLDFTCLLMLSGLWMAWRHRFSPWGLVLGGGMLVGGTPLLSSYLLVASIQAQGDVRVLLLGQDRS